MTFNPDLNPYVSKLEEHKDIIKTPPIEDSAEFKEFLQVSKKLIVDLGCGAGNFLRDYATAFEHYIFVGFELRFKRLVKGAIKMKKRDLTNVRLVQARAEEMDLWLSDRKIDELYVNFPDPWPKKKHRKHRLLSQAFFDKLKNMLNTESGFMVFKTDHKDYFNAVVDLVEQDSNFEIMELSEDLHHSEFNNQTIYTEFESLFKGKGFPVYYFKTKLQVIQ